MGASKPKSARRLGAPDRAATAIVDRGWREHYEDAPLYDYEYRRRRQDVNFYRRLARDALGDQGQILELACGSGRVTSALLRDGHQVVGLDTSAPMLARAQARILRLSRAARQRGSLVRADMRRFALGRQFPLVLMGFNSFEHLYTRVEVAACLDEIRRHLSPGGRFAFDVQNPNLGWLCRDPDRRWARTVFTHPTSGEKLVYTTNHVYDPVSQIAVIRLYYEPVDGRARPRTVTLTQRKFFPAELEALLHCNGFAVEARYGDFAGKPLGGEDESQVLVCRAR